MTCSTECQVPYRAEFPVHYTDLTLTINLSGHTIVNSVHFMWDQVRISDLHT